MSDIDYILKFTDRPTAIADATLLGAKLYDAVSDLFNQGCIFPITVWRNSQDTTVLDADGITNDVVHHPLAGFFILVTLSTAVPAFVNHSAVQLVLDRNLLRARQPGGVIRSTVGGVILQDIRFSPVPAGADYPFGGLN